VGSVETPIYRVSVAMPIVKKNEYIYKTKLFKKFYMYNFIHQKKSVPFVSSFKSDGGGLFCGSVFKSDSINTQSAWLVKTDSLGCIDNANCFPMGITSAPVVNTTITIYPNPANNVLQINCDAFAENSSIQYTITDMLGQQKLKNFALAYGHKCNIAIGNLQIGTYIITILQNHQTYHQTFIKN
jgi:hypothetical protein